MAVGARDAIDRKLAQMYANSQTTNFESCYKIEPEQILDSMALVALQNKTFINVKSSMASRKSNL